MRIDITPAVGDDAKTTVMIDGIMQRFPTFKTGTGLSGREWIVVEFLSPPEELAPVDNRKGPLPKPPLGIPPRYIVEEQRVEEIEKAVQRQLDFTNNKGQPRIPQEWITEHSELILGLANRRIKALKNKLPDADGF